MNGTFNPQWSTNDIWIDEEMTDCLTLKLEDMETDIANKAAYNHTHNGYAVTNHTHDGYAPSDHTHTGYATETHTHMGYLTPSDISGLASETYVNTKVSNLVNSAPEALNTLNELATALGNDANFATTIATQLGTKVTAVDGKGLSTNDYTTTEKTKLAGIATGANKYTLPTATSSVLGGVKVGSNITNSSGTISLTKSNVTSALGYTPFNASSTLPVAQGGTGQTSKYTNGTVTSLNNTTVTSYQFSVYPYLNKAFIRLNILTGSAIAADGAAFVALPSTIPTAHTALACYNEIGYDIHCGVSSNAGKGVYIMNSGTSSMPSGTRLYITGWYSI